MKIGSKTCVLERSQGFSFIWPSDLLFDSTWPIMELDLDFVKIKLLTKFDEDWLKNMASKALLTYVTDQLWWRLAYKYDF